MTGSYSQVGGGVPLFFWTEGCLPAVCLSCLVDGVLLKVDRGKFTAKIM